MGFDLYGANPIKNTKIPIEVTQYQDEEGFCNWNKMSDENKEEYFKYREQHEEENPGTYFRNNVWWWRPLWEFVVERCDDILTEKDIEHGSYNDGHTISKTKSKKIAARLRRLLKDGSVDKYEAQYAFNQMSAEDEECDLCKGTGKRTDMEVLNGCNGCSGKGTKRPWLCSYPFEKSNVIEFEIFCEQSGGFTIC